MDSHKVKSVTSYTLFTLVVIFKIVKEWTVNYLWSHRFRTGEEEEERRAFL